MCVRTKTVKITNLKLEGNAADGTLLDTLHEMGDKTSDLVAHGLRGDESNLSADTLVGVEVESKARVVLLDDCTSGLLDGLYANATHLVSKLKKKTKKQNKQIQKRTKKKKIKK